MVSFGGVPERSKGSDCKSDGIAFEGSNPSPSTKFGGVRMQKESSADNYMNVLKGMAGSEIS